MNTIEYYMKEYEALECSREPLIGSSSTPRSNVLACNINDQLKEILKDIDECIKKGEGSISEVISYMKYYYKKG